ncbi:MAG TPA: tol-pal system protein YbgF [Steroidobacteraceae bacterium]|nr:tol-pal system protein YbgF [Steroidobacteraceae bacterium]
MAALRGRLAAAVVLPALVLATWPLTTLGAASNKELEARANDTDSRLGALETRVNQALVELQQQIDTARQELRTLRGQIEEARHDLEQARQQQRDLYGDLDRRLLLIENASGTAAPGASGPPTAPDVMFADEAAVYGDAFAAMKAGRYEEAAKGFQLYLTKYPKGPRADNATYWLGEAQYVQLDYANALKTFEAVSAFPESRKLPDALLKVGYCQYELKAFKNARATLQKVISNYPDAEAARLAKERIDKMNAEQR